MTVGIHHLPVELITVLVSYLDSEDLGAVRQSSKCLERSSISYFGRRFFRKKGYLLTTASLETLGGVAGHEDLRKYVQHIWFNPDCYTFHAASLSRPHYAPIGDIVDTDGPLEEDRSRRLTFRQCIADHQQLLASSTQLREKLAYVFESLPNLRAIGMRRSEDHKPWGWRTLKDATGVDPRQIGPYPGTQQDSFSEPTYLFIAIINAVATAKVPISRLYTDAIEIDNIPSHVLPQETFACALGQLQYLELNIHRGWLRRNERSQITCNSEESYGEGLLRLLKAVPQLRELGLQVFADVMRSYMLPPATTDPNSWLRSYPHLTLKKQVENVALRQLERLKLEKITTSPEVLMNLLTPCQSTLASVKLRDIRLISSKDSQRQWQSIFEFFHHSCSNLTYILLYHLMYEGGGVSFVEHPPTMVAYLDVADDANNPNPPHGGTAEGEFFTKYEHIALEASGRDDVESKLERIVRDHWYQPPIFSYVMDDAVWDTDTSDEDW